MREKNTRFTCSEKNARFTCLKILLKFTKFYLSILSQLLKPQKFNNMKRDFMEKNIQQRFAL